MFKFKLIASILFVSLFFLGCKKNASGGKAQISGQVIFKGNLVTSGTVYIKYGATTSPGNDPTQYDNQVYIDASGNFTIASLYPGDYYLFAIANYNVGGLGSRHVNGGTHANIPHTKSTVNYDIATAE
ncbi:MAG: hypothetical protein ABI388_13065 [Bacteroidia bacterium]